MSATEEITSNYVEKSWELWEQEKSYRLWLTKTRMYHPKTRWHPQKSTFDYKTQVKVSSEQDPLATTKTQQQGYNSAAHYLNQHHPCGGLSRRAPRPKLPTDDRVQFFRRPDQKDSRGHWAQHEGLPLAEAHWHEYYWAAEAAEDGAKEDFMN
jgi:hypothetical protein